MPVPVVRMLLVMHLEAQIVLEVVPRVLAAQAADDRYAIMRPSVCSPRALRLLLQRGWGSDDSEVRS